MTLIIGGEAQGKRTYAENLLGSGAVTADCGVCEPEEVLTAELIIGYHLLIKRIPDAEGFTRRLCEENPGAVITLSEVGSGVIPIERAEREYRETAGRCGCILAKRAEKVIRLFCGIPTEIKH